MRQLHPPFRLFSTTFETMSGRLQTGSPERSQTRTWTTARRAATATLTGLAATQPRRRPPVTPRRARRPTALTRPRAPRRRAHCQDPTARARTQRRLSSRPSHRPCPLPRPTVSRIVEASICARDAVGPRRGRPRKVQPGGEPFRPVGLPSRRQLPDVGAPCHPCPPCPSRRGPRPGPVPPRSWSATAFLP